MDYIAKEAGRIYAIKFDDNGMLASILVEEGRFGRYLYKREPKGLELPLTDAIFEETVGVFIKNGIFKADNLYVSLRAHDKYYANLMKKVYKNLLKKYMDESSLLRDALWN